MAKCAYNPTEHLIREVKLGKDSFLYLVFPENQIDIIHVLLSGQGDLSSDLIIGNISDDNKLSIGVAESGKLKFSNKDGNRFPPKIEDQLSTFFLKGDKTFSIDASFPYLSKGLREIVGHSVICDQIADLDPEFKPQLMPIQRGYSIFVSTKHDDKDVRKAKLKLIGREYHDVDPVPSPSVPTIPITENENTEESESKQDDLKNMTVNNLKLLAASEGIEINKNWKKSDIIQAIKDSRLDKATTPE